MPRIPYHYEVLHNDEHAKLFTYLLLVLNFVYAILGAMMLAAGFYICLDENFREYMQDLDMTSYMVGVYILLVAGILVILMAFFGICGAYLKRPGMLLIFIVLLVIALILEIAGASYLLANGTKNSKMTVILQTNLYNLISMYTYDATAKRSLDIVQQWIGCCGAMGIADFVNWNILVPSSCYDPITGNAWYRKGVGYVGCVDAVSIYVEKGTGWISGLAFFLALFQIIGICCTVFLLSIMRDFKKKSMGDLSAR